MNDRQYQHSITSTFPVAASVFLSVITFGIFTYIYYGLMHSKLPKIKSDDFSGGRAIGFLFIPFFNIGWIAIFWIKLVDRINHQFRARNLEPVASMGLAIVTLVVFYSTLTLTIITGAPFTLVTTLMLAIFAGNIQHACNILARLYLYAAPEGLRYAPAGGQINNYIPQGTTTQGFQPKASMPPIFAEKQQAAVESAKPMAAEKEQGAAKEGPVFLEKDNMGTLQDNKSKAIAYWMGERMRMSRKDPFVLYSFKSQKDAVDSLLELPCIHVAEDSKRLICTERLIYGCYEVEAGYEAIVCGDTLTVELYEKARESFISHGGTMKNCLEPTFHAGTKKTEAHPEKVYFVKNQYSGGATYKVYSGPDEISAMAFLQKNPVDKDLYYIVVETPEGNFCRDRMGMYKEDM